MIRPIALAAVLAAVAPARAADPPPRVDVFGDPLPPGAVARLGSARLRHQGEVVDLAFNPDGTRLAVTSSDGTVSVWDATGRLVGRAAAGRGAGVGFAPDGRSVGVFVPGAGLRVLTPDAAATAREVAAARPVGPLGVANGRHPVPVLAPGLKWLAYRTGDEGRDCRVVVADPTSGREAAAFPLQYKGWAVYAGFSADGRRLVIGDGQSGRCVIRVCDPADGKAVAELPVEGFYPLAVSLSRDGTRVAAALWPNSDPATAVRVWDVASGRLLLDRPLAHVAHQSAALSPDGATVAVLEDRTITLVDVATGMPVRTLEARWQNGRLVFSPDGRRLAVASNGSLVELFDLATGRRLPGPDEAFDPRGLTLQADGGLRFRPDGTLLALLHGEPGLSRWDPATGRRVETIDPPPGSRLVHALSPDGRRLVYTAGQFNTVGEFRVWDRGKKADVAVSGFPAALWPRFDYAPDGRRLFLHPTLSHPRAAEVWELDPDTLRLVERKDLGLPVTLGYDWAARYSPDGRQRAEMGVVPGGGSDGTLRRWDVLAGKGGAVVRWAPANIGEARHPHAWAVSGDGRWVGVFQAPAGGDVVSVFDAADGRERVRIPVPQADPDRPDGGGRLALSQDGRLALVIKPYGPSRLYETAGGSERRRYDRVADARFAPDGRHLVTWHATTSGLVWDIQAEDPGADPGTRVEAGGAPADPLAEVVDPAVVWLVGLAAAAVVVLVGWLVWR